MFRRKRDAARDALTIQNLRDHIGLMHAQAVAASEESARRYAELEQERDEWRTRAATLLRDRDEWRKAAGYPS